MKMYKFLLIVLVFIFQSCNGQTEKINGVSFVASGNSINSSHVNPVANINANYTAIMPFSYIRRLDDPRVTYNWDGQWFGERKEGVKQYVEELRKSNIKIMLKPQIWVSRGEFTGYIEMKNEEDWKNLERAYTSFILDFAKQAEELKVEILCIGTELEKFVEKRPEYWKNLIVDIKKVYKGKLTYAANWDEFKRTPFWGQLDFIGIDAYFPVGASKTPTVNECINGWSKHKTVIKSLSDKYNKPILFTEYGYRSVDFSAKEPWKVDRTANDVNFEAQTNATQALFQTFWNEDWFAGGFVWKWFHDYEDSGGKDNNRFTPQNKPVEKIIKHYYSH